jgi:hypothetical protein
MTDTMGLSTMSVAKTKEDWGVVWLYNNSPLPPSRIESWDPREMAVFRFTPRKRCFFSLMLRDAFVVSQDLYSFLEDLDVTGVQFLPIRLQSPDGEVELERHYLLHFTHPRVSAAEAGEISRGHHMFFAADAYKQVYITLLLAKLLKAEGFAGVKILDN